MKTLDIVVYALLIIGGLNWGLVGVFNFDLVAAIFTDMPNLARIVYTIVGLAAIYDLVLIKAIWKRWDVHYRAPAHA
ncbi:MAG: DUF378 domain-containing protein [Planctomycetota bacterium]|jgi:uncharacterized membrane protein YuzA (DUF378 family)